MSDLLHKADCGCEVWEWDNGERGIVYCEKHQVPEEMKVKAVVPDQSEYKKQSEHTQGKWTKHLNEIHDEAGDIIAVVSREQDGHVQGNLDLIRSAPELLEALEGVIAMSVTGDAMPGSIKDKAIKAISKAKGV